MSGLPQNLYASLDDALELDFENSDTSKMLVSAATLIQIMCTLFCRTPIVPQGLCGNGNTEEFRKGL